MSLLYPARNADIAEDTPLSERQLARAEALLAARKALAKTAGGVFRNDTGPADALDLVQLARYIETGDDPYAPTWTPTTTEITTTEGE